MPKLNANTAKAAKKAATEDPFKPIPNGNYEMKLVKVESSKSAGGNPMWVWYFKTTKPTKGKEMREYTVLSDNMMWKFGQIFAAFGVDPDTSTDDLIGKTVVVKIGTEIQQQGKGKGRERNFIEQFLDLGTEPRLFVEGEADDDPSADAQAPQKSKKSKKPKATADDEEPPF